MDKCQREKESLYNLKKGDLDKDSKEIFQDINKGQESYFIQRKENVYSMKYAFDTLPELKEYLNNLWKNHSDMQDIVKILLVASMKNKPQNDVKEYVDGKTKKAEMTDSSDKLPEYIYVF